MHFITTAAVICANENINLLALLKGLRIKMRELTVENKDGPQIFIRRTTDDAAYRIAHLDNDGSRVVELVLEGYNLIL